VIERLFNDYDRSFGYKGLLRRLNPATNDHPQKRDRTPATPAMNAAAGATAANEAAPLAAPVELADGAEPDAEPDLEPEAEAEPDAAADECAAARVEVTTAEVALALKEAVPSSTVMYVPATRAPRPLD
jgi:hypothetical protein